MRDLIQAVRNLTRWKLVLVILIGAFFALFVLPFSAWLIGVESFEATADATFCVSCHTMTPFEKAFLEDVHGGNSTHGVQALCTDCHLSHESAFHYFVTKTQTGVHDVWVQNTGDLDSIDWNAKRQHREDYVYDSGCLQCHNNLERATMASNKAFVAHKGYFSGETDNKCVSCHEHVGHANLSTYIAQHSE